MMFSHSGAPNGNARNAQTQTFCLYDSVYCIHCESVLSTVPTGPNYSTILRTVINLYTV